MNPPDLENHVTAVLGAWLTQGRRVAVALSGGADSVVLLHILKGLRSRLDFSLSCIHVDHGISPRSARWAGFCRDLCRDWDVPFEAEKVLLVRKGGQSLEALAREARYGVFRKLSADCVVTAHHLDDQVETVLLQLLRGAGVKGLSGMPMPDGKLRESAASAPVGGGAASPAILRPLLEVPRSALLDYARTEGLSWVEDESNADVSFSRNYLRHRVTPLLEDRFPAYRQAILRSGRHMAEAAQLLDELAILDGHGARDGEFLDVAALLPLNPVRRRNLLRYFITRAGVSAPSTQRLEEMLRQILQAKGSGQVQIRFGAWELGRFQGKVYVFPGEPPVKGLAIQKPWKGESVLKIPELGGELRFHAVVGEGISCRQLEGKPVTVRLRRGGERLRFRFDGPSRSLKNLFQEQGIPPWVRRTLPLLYAGADLACVPGLGVDCAYQAASGEPGWVVQWLRHQAGWLQDDQ